MGHLAWARASHHGADLARCGVLWAVCGAALLARPIIRQRFDRWFAASRGFDGGEFADSRDPAAVAQAGADQRQTDKEALADARAREILGPVLIVAGTILWAYGDLVGDWLFALPSK